MQKGSNESSTIKGNKISINEVKSKRTEEVKRWRPHLMGKEKIRILGNSYQVSEKTMGNEFNFITPKV